MRKKLTNVLPLLLISVIWFLIGWTLHSQFSKRVDLAANRAAARISSVYTLLQNRQYTPHIVTDEQLSYAAIQGMLAETQDPYAVLFTPPASTAYAADMAGGIAAPGIWKQRIDGKFVITRIEPGEGAERAGLKAGDILLGVNGIQFDKNTTIDEASILLRGPVGTTAKVMVKREDTILEYEVPRDEWIMLTSRVIGDQIGYVQQNLIPLNANSTMQQHLQSLATQNVQALIWDLRDNGGGSVQATEEILNNFIAKGDFYIAEYKDGQRQTFSADGSAKFTDLPMVVLINESTYSAGEIAAIALAENQRALLIGTPTEGKGLIQDVIPLDEDHLLRISIAKWLSPSGRWAQGEGVTPTFTIQDDPATATDEVLDFALQYLDQQVRTQ